MLENVEEFRSANGSNVERIVIHMYNFFFFCNTDTYRIVIKQVCFYFLNTDIDIYPNMILNKYTYGCIYNSDV